MKLITALIVVALAGSSAAYSNFTNDICNQIFLDNSSMITNLDNIYTDLSSSASTFTTWSQYSSNYLPEVVQYITQKRQNYQPWCTAIQKNINDGKATATKAILAAYGTWSKVPDMIEQSYNQMVANFAKRGCSNFPQYQSNYTIKLSNVLQILSNQVSNYPTSMTGSIPSSSLLYQLYNAINFVTSQQAKGAPQVTLIKQAEAVYMQQTSDLYSSAVAQTTKYTRTFFTKSFSGAIERLSSVLKAMATGAKTATCQ